MKNLVPQRKKCPLHPTTLYQKHFAKGTREQERRERRGERVRGREEGKERQRDRGRKRDLYRCLWRLGSPSLPTRLDAYTFLLREAKEMRDEVRYPAGTRDQKRYRER